MLQRKLVRKKREFKEEKKKFRLNYTLLVLVILFLLGISFVVKSGTILITGDEIEHSTWAVLLAGDEREMNRVDGAQQLLSDQTIDFLVISSQPIFKTQSAGQIKKEYLVNQGIDSARILVLENEAYSTIAEAKSIIPFFHSKNIDSVLIITSNYHTTRSKYIFNSLSGGKTFFSSMPLTDSAFDPNSWVMHRASAKTWLMEWMKLIFSQFELWFGSNELLNFNESRLDVNTNILIQQTPSILLDSTMEQQENMDSGSSSNSDEEEVLSSSSVSEVQNDSLVQE